MLTAKMLATCIFTAAQTYSVPPTVLLAILHVEGGRVGMASPNTNGSYDLGPMQINTLWLKPLSKHWRVSEKAAMRLVRDNACINIGVGAWILRKKVLEANGSLAGGIMRYHSATPGIGDRYREKVFKALKKYQFIRQPSDLVSGDRARARRGPG